ncbi:hypothetical protein ABS735_07190 [Streptomyces sp. MMCC 100]|uniref:hypothetical protein n=1 Tax=Streptomyces sp. MMCC 100 TaxID=3163555 RepID=UPI003599A813
MKASAPAARGKTAGAHLFSPFGSAVVETTARYRPDDVGRTSGVLMGADLVAQIDARLDRLGRPLVDDDVEPFTRVLYETCRALPAAGSIYRHASVYAAFTGIHNVTGMPAMSVPFGHDGRGLPLGVQFAARLGGEGTLLALGAQLERSAPWVTA